MKRIIKDVLSIKSVQKTLNIFALLSILVMAAPLANLTASAAQNNNTAACFHHNNANGSVVLKNGYAVGTFRVPNDCKVRQQVSLGVYKINDGIWQHRLNNQFLYASKTHWYGPGVHTISVPVPSNCAWQADLVKGTMANLAANGGTQKHGLAAKVGGDKVPCKPAPKPTPKPTPTPPAPAPVKPTPAPAVSNTNINNNSNVNTVNVEAGGTTETATTEGEVVATESVSSKDGTPTELANTGPGGVIAAFVGFTTLGSLAYRLFIARRLGIDV